MKLISVTLIILVGVSAAAGCTGNRSEGTHQGLQRTGQQLQRAQLQIKHLKDEQRDLTAQVELNQARGAELERLVRELAAQNASPSCPLDNAPHKRPDVRAVAFAYGEGPVFVGLGTGDGIVLYTLDSKSHKGWYYNKTLWAVAPRYTGEVVITGEQIDGPARVRFNLNSGFPGKNPIKLRLPAIEGSDWRYAPSSTLIRAPVVTHSISRATSSSRRSISWRWVKDHLTKSWLTWISMV